MLEPSKAETWGRALLPTASAMAAASLALLAAVWAGPGCQTACQGDFDCIGAGFCNAVTGRCERECFTDENCRNPPACRDNPTACRPLGLYCSGRGRCLGAVEPSLGDGVVTTAPRGGGPRSIEGWEDPPALGYAYIVSQLALAGPERGFDLNGCTSEGCVDNALGALAPLANTSIREGVRRGQSLLLLELAGLDDAPYTGDDETFTIKIYGAKDADDPVLTANNFSVPPSHDRCCEFHIDARSLVSPPAQARARAPAVLENGRFRSLAPVDIPFILTVGPEPHPLVRIENALIEGRIGRNLASLERGLIGGALPASTVSTIENPFCRAINDPGCPDTFKNSSLLDLIVALVGPQPDIDLDLDGAECLFNISNDVRIDRCCDGRGPGVPCNLSSSQCGGTEVLPLDPADPASCAASPSIEDGYSVAFEFSATRASILGTGN